jgi:hypothetical protein
METINPLFRKRKKFEDDVKKYVKKYRDFKVRIKWLSSEELNPDFNIVDVILETGDGNKYSSNFITRRYLDYLFEKNKRTGECAGGVYFAVPNMVVIEKLTDEQVKRTIDDMVNNLEVEEYFTKID